MNNRLQGKKVLITGASRGIGRAVAICFAREGASVAINYIGSESDAEQARKSAEDASRSIGIANPKHFIVQADVADETAVAGMFATVDGNFGWLDILVNNAGIQIETPSHEARAEDIEKVMSVNLNGAVYCSQAAIRRFLEQRSGGIILNCSSVHQIIPKPAYLSYSLSKGAIGNLTRTLALEYAEYGIRVNGVAPGATITDLNESWINDPAAQANVERHIPLGRAAKAEEIAGAFLFLASEDAAYITGQTLYVCGGLTLYNDFRENWSS